MVGKLTSPTQAELPQITLSSVPVDMLVMYRNWCIIGLLVAMHMGRRKHSVCQGDWEGYRWVCQCSPLDYRETATQMQFKQPHLLFQCA